MSDSEVRTGPGTPPGSRSAARSAGRQERAERILDATAGLLHRHGYKRVTIDDVAVAAGVGKGTIYLHWKTREALFWAVLQRETVRMLEQILADLEHDPGLAMPGALMRAIFLQTARRPLVRALLLADPEVLGGLARDEAVAAAQAELAGNQDYLEMLREQGLLRPGLTAASAGYVLGSVMRGFFAGQAGPVSTAPARAAACASASRLTCSRTCCGRAWRPASRRRPRRSPRSPPGCGGSSPRS